MRILNRAILSFIVISGSLFAQNYPDQHYVLQGSDLLNHIETNDGLKQGENGSSLLLMEGRTSGYVVLTAQTTQFPFDQGLPSWNGSSSGVNNGFVVQMRFPYGIGWSPWLTAGYWKDFIWSSYGPTSYGGGGIDYDYVLLNSPQSAFQFKVLLSRISADDPSPAIHELSFFVSDSRTTSSVDIPAIVADNPEPIFIPTEFYYQYSLDPEIGGSICSPTTVSMILRSYEIAVDPVHFARDTYDPYWGIFGMWPRVVQNAAEYGLDGAVTRYRTWSDARKVLAAGGRIAMSVGPPLYSGHLIMLAGFTSDGRPIVHDPAKSNGYSYVFNKSSLSRSWFEKGGIGYTFYLPGYEPQAVEAPQADPPCAFDLMQNYPNPFNAATTLMFTLAQDSDVQLAAYDIRGGLVATLCDEWMPAGRHTLIWNAADLPSGAYFIRLMTPLGQKMVKTVLAK